jgi:hypothetical protein
MRKVTAKQATAEVEVLDQVSASLEKAIRSSYEQIQADNPRFGGQRGDIEFAANLHNRRLSQVEALEEIARRGYGRVAFVTQISDAGKAIRTSIHRVSQANANLAEASIVARNGPLGSAIASCKPGEEFEVVLPGGERFYVTTALIELEGTTHLLRPKPDAKLARFHVADDAEVDIIRGLRAFVEGLSPKEAAPPALLPLIPEVAEKPKKLERVELHWPTDWSKVILADEPEAALSAQFFTRTTLHQEEAIRAVRGVTVVHGIAGTGKTSVALGRLKFFANFRSGEHLQEYGLNPNDWVDFDSKDMIGFVLSPSLVHYLKQTAEDLELHMKIMDFEEFRNQERQSRRLFGHQFKRSPDQNPNVQRTIRWLRALADVASLQIAAEIEGIQREVLAKPNTPDGNRTSSIRWTEIENKLWKTGPLNGRITGLIRRLRRRDVAFRLQGIANVIDNEVRLSDAETAGLSDRERRAVREAILNVSLRLFRLLNPSELYVTAHCNELIRSAFEKEFKEQADEALRVSQQTISRLQNRLITDDDVVTALCLNALTCDQFEREIRDIPYLVTFSDRIGIFIDEYQDFNEQQVFLMGFRAKRKYRQITVSGDRSQRLHADGVTNVTDLFPYISESVRHIFLDRNFRQSKPLAALSACFRTFTEDGKFKKQEPCGAPIYTYDRQAEFAEFAAAKIADLPEAANVVVISPNFEMARSWYAAIGPSLESAFRNPIVSDRARLTERLKTHFTTSLEAKGLEFDVALIPDISEFNETDPIELNALYVAVSRPRHAILLGCRSSCLGHKVVKQLCDRGDLVAVPSFNHRPAA